MKVTKEELDLAFAELLAYADFEKITKAYNIFTSKECEMDDILGETLDNYEKLCSFVISHDLNDEDIPVGFGDTVLQLSFVGNDPFISLDLNVAFGYKRDI